MPSMETIENLLLETHFDIIPFDIYVVDVRNFEIVFVNRHFRDRFGHHVGRNCHESLYESPRPCLFCKIPYLVDSVGRPNGKTYVYEHFNEVDDRWYQLQEKAIAWPDGRTVKYTIAVDVTELKATQNRLAEAHAQLALRNRELQRQNEVLQENLQLREHLERITAHDLKSPLGAIIDLPIALAESYNLPEEVRGGLEAISEAGTKTLEFVNRSLDLYRLEAGIYQLKPDRVFLAPLLDRVTGASLALARSKGVTVRAFLDGRPLAVQPEAAFTGEELLCYSMLANLVENAVDASPEETEVRIDITMKDGGIEFAVTNLGEVPADIRERFFEKYVTAGKVRGTGLGTYMARLAAEAHGGRIRADFGTPGRTTIRVWLPGAKE